MAFFICHDFEFCSSPPFFCLKIAVGRCSEESRFPKPTGLINDIAEVISRVTQKKPQKICGQLYLTRIEVFWPKNFSVAS